MAARPVTHRRICSAKGCVETSFIRFDTTREYREWRKEERNQNPWLCIRHLCPDKVLSADNLERASTLTAAPHQKVEGKLFWKEEDGRIGSGYVSGPGFKAFAKDFPEGTKLEIIARIIPAE